MFHTERASVCRVPRVEESLMPGMNSKAGMAGAQGASTGVAGGKAPEAGRGYIRLRTISVYLYPKTNEKPSKNFK